MSEVHASRGRLRARLAAPAQRGGDHQPARPPHARSTDGPASRGRTSRRTTARSATGSRGSSRASRTSTSGSRSPAASRCPTRSTSGVYPTPSGKAVFTLQRLRRWLRGPAGHLVLQTLRSHDQWNTIPYAMNDRYRGHPQRPPRRAGQPRRPRGPRPRRRRLGRHRQRLGRRRRAPRRRASGSSPTPRAAAPPRRTTRRPTSWCRSTASPTSATRPTSKGVIVRFEPTTPSAAGGGQAIVDA